MMKLHPFSGRLSAFIAVSALVTAIVATAAPSGADEVVAGEVLECQNLCKDIKVRRFGRSNGSAEEVAVRPTMLLFVGDVVIIPDTNHRLFVRLGPHERQLIEFTDSPFTVEMPKEGPGYWQNLVMALPKKILAVFANLYDRHEAREAASLTSRGSACDQDGLPLNAGLFRHHGMKVAAQMRPFSLKWCGGTPPYSVRLFKDGELKPLIALDEVRERQAFVDRVPFTVGTYRVELKDAVQRQAAEFQAVDRARLPLPAAGSGLEPLPADMSGVLLATWRAGLDDGVWALESFLAAAELAQSYPPALALRDALAAGDLPAQ